MPIETWFLRRLHGTLSRSVRQDAKNFEILPIPHYSPAHPHATDAVVYTALFYCNCYIKLPNNSGPVNHFPLFLSSCNRVIYNKGNWWKVACTTFFTTLLYAFVGLSIIFLDCLSHRYILSISRFRFRKEEGGKVIFWCCPELRYKIHRTHLKMLLL